MPTEFKRKRSFRRTQSAPQLKRSKSMTATIPRGLQFVNQSAFPKSTIVKLKFAKTINLNPDQVTPLVHHYFRANSCYDPDQSGVGHQPLGFDEWSTFYNHYVVLGSKCSFTGSTASSTARSGYVQGVLLSATTDAPTDVETYMEQGPVVWKGNVNMQNGAGQPKTVTKNFSAKKFFNVTNVNDNTSRIGAIVTTNPTEQAYYACSIGSIDPGAGDPDHFYGVVVIEYIVQFSEPKNLTSS